MRIKARFVVPVDGPAIVNGAIDIADGTIGFVGPADQVGGSADVDYGDAVLCPAFVNAHTHLELGFLAGLIPLSFGFVDWLGKLVENLKAHPPTQQLIQSAVRQGVQESLSHGVVTMGDIARHTAWVREALMGCPARVTSFGEVIAIGSGRSFLAERLGQASKPFELPDDSWNFSNGEGGNLGIGISPHAPYTVEPDGLSACADLAQRNSLPLAIHVLESADEEAFTLRGEGRLSDHLKRVGVWDDRIATAGYRPVELLGRCGVLGKRTLLIHANYVEEDDIRRIAESGSHVVFCPRTHAAFGHRPHRFEQMLWAGINVCVGTDSLASNPSLSILDELRCIAQSHRDMSRDLILTMGTLRGARALGMENDIGSLTVGKHADIVVVPLESGTPLKHWTQMFDTLSPPQAVYLRGKHLAGGGAR
ncbi:MAG: amidohydrolase family protein [Planctomycetota bacterium]